MSGHFRFHSLFRPKGFDCMFIAEKFKKFEDEATTLLVGNVEQHSCIAYMGREGEVS